MAEEAAVRTLIEKQRIGEVINTLFVATDEREWARVRSCFAAEVLFDMTSVTGGAPERVPPDRIIAGWQTGLAAIESLHHQTGNLSITVDGSQARGSCYGIAYHYRRTASGRNTRVFVGSYDFQLHSKDGTWRIDLFRFKVKFVDGNLELEKEPGAAAR